MQVRKVGGRREQELTGKSASGFAKPINLQVKTDWSSTDSLPETRSRPHLVSVCKVKPIVVNTVGEGPCA